MFAFIYISFYSTLEIKLRVGRHHFFLNDSKTVGSAQNLSVGQVIGNTLIVQTTDYDCHPETVEDSNEVLVL